MSCPECGGDTGALPDYDESKGDIARLQKIIAEQADQIRKGVGESRVELEDARQKNENALSSAKHLDAQWCKAERKLVVEKKRREIAEGKLDVILANAPLVTLVLEGGEVMSVQRFLSDTTDSLLPNRQV